LLSLLAVLLIVLTTFQLLSLRELMYLREEIEAIHNELPVPLGRQRP